MYLILSNFHINEFKSKVLRPQSGLKTFDFFNFLSKNAAGKIRDIANIILRPIRSRLEKGVFMVNEKTYQKIRGLENILLEKIIAELNNSESEIEAEYSRKMKKEIKAELSDIINYLSQALVSEKENIFSSYIYWLNSTLKSRDYRKDFIIKILDGLNKAAGENFSDEEFKLINKYLISAKKKINSEAEADRSYLSIDNPMAEEAENYLKLLLNMKREEAVKYILELSKSGKEISDIYLNIFQPVQYEIGRLWQINEITIAQEHYATSVTQLAAAQLYPYIFSVHEKNKKCVTTSIGDELHELGIRMVADLLELDGWDTIHLGANTPVPEIINTIHENNAEMVAVSATMASQLDKCRTFIKELKNNDLTSEVKVMVGGRLFIKNPELWEEIGADSFAVDAAEAVKEADSLL